MDLKMNYVNFSGIEFFNFGCNFPDQFDDFVGSNSEIQEKFN